MIIGINALDVLPAPGGACPWTAEATVLLPRPGARQAPTPFPVSYDQAMRQAQEAVKLALADGAQLLEVEFPPTTLSSSSGEREQ